MPRSGSRARGSSSAAGLLGAKNFVAWVYADPVGPEHNTLNCSISDLELEVERDGQPAERLTVVGAAAYEFGTRDLTTASRSSPTRTASGSARVPRSLDLSHQRRVDDQCRNGLISAMYPFPSGPRGLT